jgi:hypothetical protein
VKRIKEIITVENRISMFQTAMNNAGRNFEGKRTTVKKMGQFAADLYKFAIGEISEIGKMDIKQLEKMVTTPTVEKQVKKVAVKKLLKKISRARGRK